MSTSVINLGASILIYTENITSRLYTHLLHRLVPIPGHVKPCELYGVSPEHELARVKHHPIPGTQVDILNSLPEALLDVVIVQATVVDALLEVGHPLCDVVGPLCVPITTGTMGPIVSIPPPLHDEGSDVSGSLREFQAVIPIPTIQHGLLLIGGYAGHQLVWAGVVFFSQG